MFCDARAPYFVDELFEIARLAGRVRFRRQLAQLCGAFENSVGAAVLDTAVGFAPNRFAVGRAIYAVRFPIGISIGMSIRMPVGVTVCVFLQRTETALDPGYHTILDPIGWPAEYA